MGAGDGGAGRSEATAAGTLCEAGSGMGAFAASVNDSRLTQRSSVSSSSIATTILDLVRRTRVQNRSGYRPP